MGKLWVDYSNTMNTFDGPRYPENKKYLDILLQDQEVFEKFMEFKSLIENHLERRIKIMRSDNGGEYTSK